MDAATLEVRPARVAGTLDRFDAAVLGCLFLLSLSYLVWIFLRGGEFGGWEGFVVADQGQYLAWIRESGEHLLIANRFDMRPDSHVFLHPTLLLSGLLYAVGVPASLAYLLWKPVAVGVLFYGVWRYVRRMLPRLWERRAALVLALFFVSPLAVLSPLWGEAGRGTFDFISGEIWPAGHLWGYPMSAIAVGLTPLVFLAAESALRSAEEAGRRAAPGRGILLAAGAALLVSALHPWQGAMLVGVLVAAALWQALAREISPLQAARVLWPVLLAPLVPAAYYFLLGLSDASWELSQENYSTSLDATMSWRLALALAPLAVPALLGYRGRAEGLQDRVLRLWVPLGVLLYVFPETPVRFHAFNGLSIPLAILAVRGAAPYLRRWARRIGQEQAAAAAIAGCAFLVLPGTVDRIRSGRGAVYLNQQPYNLDTGDRDALDAMERASGGGGVMTSIDLAALVPYRSGRETWVGTPSWSPDFGPRATAVSNLLAGRLTPPQARRLVRSSRVRFVLRDCRAHGDLRVALGPIARTSRYGCATLYEVDRSGG